MGRMHPVGGNGGEGLHFYESFIYLLTFLLINLPIYMTINRRLLRKAAFYKKALFTAAYWAVAFYAYEVGPFIGVLVLIGLVHRKEETDLNWSRDINVWAFNPPGLLAVAGLSLLFKAAVGILNEAYGLLLKHALNIVPEPQEIVNDFMQGETYLKFVLLVLAVVMAPVVEEYVFRYFIYDKLLLPRMPALAAAVISSALFTLLHNNIGGIPTFFGLGLFCVYVYERYGFYGALLAHGMSNLITAVLLI